MKEIKKIKKIMEKLEKKYDKEKSQIKKNRMIKKMNSLQNRLDHLTI